MTSNELIKQIMTGNDNLRNVQDNPLSQQDAQEIIDLWDTLLMYLHGEGFDLMDLPNSAIKVIFTIDSILNNKQETKK